MKKADADSMNVGRVKWLLSLALSLSLHFPRPNRESNLQIFDLDTLRLIKEIDQFEDLEKRNVPMVQPYCGYVVAMVSTIKTSILAVKQSSMPLAIPIIVRTRDYAPVFNEIRLIFTIRT